MLRKLILLGIGGFVLTVGGLATLLVAVLSANHGTRLEFNGGEVFYTEAAQESEANALGRFLVDDVEFFDGGHKSVQLDRRSETLVVRFVVIEGAWDNAEARTGFSAMQMLLSMDVFDGEPVEVHLCDAMLDTQYVIPATGGESLAGVAQKPEGNG